MRAAAWYATNQVPVDLTTGTSTDTFESYVGQWDRLWLGIRTELVLGTLVERYAEFGQLGFLVWVRADVQLARCVRRRDRGPAVRPAWVADYTDPDTPNVAAPVPVPEPAPAPEPVFVEQDTLIDGPDLGHCAATFVVAGDPIPHGLLEAPRRAARPPGGPGVVDHEAQRVQGPGVNRSPQCGHGRRAGAAVALQHTACPKRPPAPRRTARPGDIPLPAGPFVVTEGRSAGQPRSPRPPDERRGRRRGHAPEQALVPGSLRWAGTRRVACRHLLTEVHRPGATAPGHRWGAR